MEITFWCPTPALRDAISGPCDAALAGIDHLSMPDGLAARLRYERSAVSDRSENESLYRRDLFYSVEYSTSQAMSAPKVSTQQLIIQRGLEKNSPTVKTLFN